MSRHTTVFILAGLLLANVVVMGALAGRTSVYEQLDLLVDVRHEIVTEYVEEPDESKMIDAAVRAMVESLGDPYTVYLAPQELPDFDKRVRGTFSGIGAEIDLHENRLRIVTPLEDSPAWKSGILAGDIVLEIEGQSTEGITTAEAIKKLTGEAGTDVTIKVRHTDGKVETITVTRAVIQVPTLKGFRKNGDNTWNYMLDAQRKIGYVRLTQFTEESQPRLSGAIEQLHNDGMKAMILDLRFNPGGLLDSAVSISDLFLSPGKTIVSVRGRAHRDQEYQSTDEADLRGMPLVVLVNEASASASEIVAGALKDNGRAVIIGTRTFGKGSVQQLKLLEANQGAIKITNALYYLPSGRNIHKREGQEYWGVDPTDGFYVPMTDEQVIEMLKVRRESGIDSGNLDKPVTPDMLEQDLKDVQLAAALRAVVGRLDDGDWPKVGKESGETLARQAEIDRLKRLRNDMKTRLDDVDERIAKLSRGEPVPDNGPAAPDGDDGDDN